MFVSQLLILNSMTFESQKGLFRIDDNLADIHVGCTGKEPRAEDNLLTPRELAEVGKGRRHTIGTRIVEQRVDGTDERVVAVV